MCAIRKECNKKNLSRLGDFIYIYKKEYVSFLFIFPTRRLKKSVQYIWIYIACGCRGDNKIINMLVVTELLYDNEVQSTGLVYNSRYFIPDTPHASRKPENKILRKSE